MMVKIQLSLVRVEGAGCMPSSFHSIYHQEQSCVVLLYAPHIYPLPFSPLWAEPQNTYKEDMKKGECICPLSWSVHWNFVRDGKYLVEWKGVGVHPPSSPTRADFSIIRNVRQEAAIATLCLLWGWACTPTLTSQGWFFHHDGMYARNRSLSLFVFSVVRTVKDWRVQCTLCQKQVNKYM
jgi:hypothetical protein